MANDIPTPDRDAEHSEYARYLEYQLSDEEVAALNELAEHFQDSLKEVFGPRAEIAVVNLCGSLISHLLMSQREGFHVFCTINEWLDVAWRRHGGRPFKLDYGIPFTEPDPWDKHPSRPTEGGGHG